MDRNIDYNPYQNFDLNYFDQNSINQDPMFNPMLQYEQAYMYYRYLTMQTEYKIKCKEYEKICNQDKRKIE